MFRLKQHEQVVGGWPFANLGIVHDEREPQERLTDDEILTPS